MKSFNDLILDWEATTNSQPELSVEIEQWPTVNPKDWEAVTVINPDLDQGPWIAGGAALRWYQGLPVGENDIDVFCNSREQADIVIAKIKAYGRYSVKYDSENATTFDYWSKDDRSHNWTIQVIKRRYFPDIQSVINSFDITVCEIGTAGHEWELGVFTAKDIRKRNLNFKLPLQPDALKRLVKYWTYGYRPVQGTLEAVQDNPVAKWTYSVDEDYNNAF